ncbi:MAG: alpha-hydroxy acid oxidase [Gemmatimonadaceae bacterium]
MSRPTEASDPVDPKRILSLAEFEEIARVRIPHATYEYLAAGAGDEQTLRWNRESFDRILLRPRVLRDVLKVDTTLTLLGRQLEFPILLAPTAFHRAIHPDGEIATAIGAGSVGVPWVISTATTTSLDEIKRAATGPLWFQLYIQTDRSVTHDLIQKAESIGCEALCLTVDSAAQGARNRQTRARFELPAGITAPYMGELVAGRNISDNRRGSNVTWDDLEWLVSVSKVPVVVKGILDGRDAARCIDSGAGGIVVSNHGARNLDTIPAAIDALPEVAHYVAGRVPVLIDGGIRRGTDIVKAIALGANAVLVGRPYCYGLALAGADGVQRVLEILTTELQMAMQLMGLCSLSEINSSALWSSKPEC